MKECPYVQIPLTADSFANIHENSFEQVAAPVAEKTVEIDSAQAETSIPDDLNLTDADLQSLSESDGLYQ